MQGGIKQLSPTEFPSLLSEIPDPPKQLFLRGLLPDSDYKLLTIVGSRAASPYAKDVVDKFVGDLFGYKVAIISGLALGVDSIAHRAALKARLPTIAVPGSGLGDNVLYPASNRVLAKTILESGGALLSEYDPDFKATQWSFPKRNRIMAGMAHATLIIEATEKSGTLITARLALDYNRDVMTVPHSIFSKASYGPHYLIKNGATPVCSHEDILEVLHIDREETEKEYDHLSSEEQKVIDLLSFPIARDELIKELEIPISEANAVLTTLELKGLIIERMGEVHLA